MTRRDVARLAGVSDAVVTYTLNGAAPVAVGTAARVRDAIRVLGYTPNASARALRMGTSKLLGVIVPDATNLFTADLCRAVDRAARAEGYDVLTMYSGGDHARIGELVQVLASRQVDGVLLALVVDEQDVTVLDASGLVWAVLNPTEAVPGARGVGVDLEEGARIATEHLLWHGYRSVGFVGPSKDARIVGWRAALEAAGVEPGPIFECDFTREEGYRAGIEVAARSHELDAVFIGSDMIANAALRAIHEGGLDVPGDLAIVSFDGSAEAEYSWPALTTVYQPIGALAVRALDHLLGRQPQQPGTIALLRGELVIRSSCGC